MHPLTVVGKVYGPHHTIAGIGATKEAIMHQIIQISCLGSAATLELETCQSHLEPGWHKVREPGNQVPR